MRKRILALLLLVTILFSMNIISVFAAGSTNNSPKVYSEGINTLNLEGEFVSDGNDGAIWVKNGAQLTINGTNSTKVHAALGQDDYSMAVWAQGEGTKVIINGGYYTNETDGSERGTDLIYASGNAKIEINGGTFKAAVEKWTLNCKDNPVNPIIVKGGTFYKFDPSNANVGEGEIVVPEGYEVVKSGDWYTVYKEHTITVKEAEGGKIIVREASNTTAGAEINKAFYGNVIEVVVEPAEGYKFKGISGVDGLTNVAEYAYQFTMPDKDIVLTPVFEKYTIEADASDAIVNQEEIENVILESFNEILKEDKDLAEEVKNRDINVELNVEKVDSDLILEADIKSFKDALSKKEANAKLVTEFMEITVDIFDKDSKEHIVSLSKLKEPVTLRIPVPEGMEKLSEGYERVFYVVREHIGENGLEYTILDAKLSEDGKYLEFTTDRFSLYAVAYNDVEKTVVTPSTGEGETEVEPENTPVVDDSKDNADTSKDDKNNDGIPQTGDNVVTYIVLATVAMIGIVVFKRLNKSKGKH